MLNKIRLKVLLTSLALVGSINASGQALPAAVLTFMASGMHTQQLIQQERNRTEQLLAPAARGGAPIMYDPIVIQRSWSGAGIFNSGVIFIADQIDRNIDPEIRRRPTVITSFANLNNLGESSNLGRLVGEHMMHELQVRGWNVADIRVTKDLIINDSGEFSLSRDIKLLREAFPLSNVVTGTYSVTGEGVLMSIRVIDSASGRVVSTAQTRFMRDAFIASLIERPVVYPTVRLRRACPTNTPCDGAQTSAR
jgi:TolB-like protein